MVIDYKRYPQPRTRHHTNPQFYLPASQLQVLPAHYPPLRDQISWAELFARDHSPNALDIGCGWGSFLMNYAELHPECNVLGIETRQPPTEWINGVISGEKIDNAHALWYSVANGLGFIPTSSVQSVFYFFPDPWFKKRHLKRRAFTQDFLAELHRVLQPDGRLYLMTDVPEVDAYQMEVLLSSGAWDVQLIEHDNEWIPVRTDHEEHCQRLGFPYVRRLCTKRQ